MNGLGSKAGLPSPPDHGPKKKPKRRARKPKAPKLPKDWAKPIEAELLALNDLCGLGAESRLKAALARGVAEVEKRLGAKQ